MSDRKLASEFAKWVDGVLSAKLPDGVFAFHFNMYEGPDSHDVQIVGCPTYDPDDSDWACDDIFMSDDPLFELPHESVGRNWERALEEAIKMLKAYLETDRTGARRMRESKAVSIGFVDGDLHLVWRNNDA